MPRGLYESRKRGGKRPGAGRPSIPINWDLVDKYFAAGATGAQVAAILGLCAEHFAIRISKEKGMNLTAYRYEKWEKGNAALLGKQFELAVKGDKMMLIWLGKNRLGQTDKFESKTDQKLEIIQKCILELPDNGRRKAIEFDGVQENN